MYYFIPYLVKLSVALGAVYLFYQLFLRRLTFYTWNRWYLLVYSLLAFWIPLVNITPFLEQQPASYDHLWQAIPVIEQYTAGDTPASTAPATDGGIGIITILLALLLVGMVIFLSRLVIRYISFRHIRKKAVLLFDRHIRIYQVDQPITPFAFGNAVFINQHRHSEDELKEIIRHEFIHIRQRHTADVLWSEILCILNWYNPFAWLIRRAIRQNLEFIADHTMLKSGVEKKQYQYLLLKVVGESSFRVATSFNFSALKKRITMMNKTKTAKVHLGRFLFVVPVITLLLISFRNLDTASLPGGDHIVAQITAMDTLPVPPSPPVPPVAPAPPASPAAPVPLVSEVAPLAPAVPAPPAAPKLPANVKAIHVVNNLVTVTLKNGKTEKYDLDKPKEKAAFGKKYGKLPAPPPPPSVPVPAVPRSVKGAAAVETTVPDVDIQAVGPAVTISAASTSRQGTYAYTVAPTSSVATEATEAVTLQADHIIVGSPVTETIAVAEEDRLLEITRHTTRAQLEEMKKMLADDGYELKIENVNYDDGNLTSIRGRISNRERHASFVADDFSRVTITARVNAKGVSGFTIHIYGGRVKA